MLTDVFVAPGICGPTFRSVCERKSIQSTAPVQQQHVLFRCPLLGPASAQDFASFPLSTWILCHSCSTRASENAAQGGAKCSRGAESQSNRKAQASFPEPIRREALAPWKTLERPALAQVDDADRGAEKQLSGTRKGRGGSPASAELISTSLLVSPRPAPLLLLPSGG